jgi:phenylacetate-CoA ligase
VTAAWGVRPANVYATTEAPIIAYSSPQDPCLDVAEDLVVLEVVDASGRPDAPGRPGERVLVTNLAGRTVPLIRYEIGDVVTPADGPSPAGRPYARLAGVQGRSADVLRPPARAMGPCPCTASASAARWPRSPTCAGSSSATTSAA